MALASIQANPRLLQGDVYRDVPFLESADEHDGTITVSTIEFPLVVVLTQDCDLLQDTNVRFNAKPGQNQDKFLFSVLVAPIYVAKHVYDGTHLSDLPQTMRVGINNSSSVSSLIKQNEIPRYHFLSFPPAIQIPDAIIDFKHYFSVGVGYLNKERSAKYVCSIEVLYRERLTQRFSNFLSRIGLPDAE